MSKKKRRAKKHAIRFCLMFIIFGTITAILGYNLYANLSAIGKMQLQKKELQSKIVALKNEKEVLESDILKLQNPEYIAKYVREKYFYSKDGEYILRIEK